ncbi:MAG: hypothetical protein Q7T74_06375 [Candidatus Saccharibacteria bacterium]|nr:hypothetical protein [Candidatus Saccharibacteria bacterium]
MRQNFKPFKKSMNNINFELKRRLLSTSRHLLIHALEHALADIPTECDVLQAIVNLQASFELLGKMHILQRKGWMSIVDHKFHSQTESELLAAISDGTLRTIPFWKSRKLATETFHLNDDDLQLLDNFQTRRNQLMHLGLANPPSEILNEVIWFLVKIIQQLDWKEFLPAHQQYLSNSLKLVIGEELFKKLIKSTCYVDESVDRAHELYPGDVTYCLECGHHTLALTNTDEYLCFVCGFQTDTGTMGMIDCPSCRVSRTIAYDKANIVCNEKLDGKCCRCRIVISVARCKTCESDYVSEHGCISCNKHSTTV